MVHGAAWNSTAVAAPPPVGEASVTDTSGSIFALKFVYISGVSSTMTERPPEATPEGCLPNEVPQLGLRPLILGQHSGAKGHDLNHLLDRQDVSSIFTV